MLAKGYLASTSLYASIAHTPDVVDAYLDALSPVLAQLAQFDDSGLMAHLPQGKAHAGFARLT